MPSLRFLPALFFLATLSGCSLLGVDEDLDLGTFEFRADGVTYSGEAVFRPRLDLPLSLAGIYLTPQDGPFMFIGSDELLTVEAGDRLEPLVQFRPPGARFTYRSGNLTITGVSDGHIEGRFDFRLRDVSMGPGVSGEIRARGRFHALRAEE
jgi:hypothetical protein